MKTYTTFFKKKVLQLDLYFHPDLFPFPGLQKVKDLIGLK